MRKILIFCDTGLCKWQTDGRIFDVGGLCPSLRATGYKNPYKFLVNMAEIKEFTLAGDSKYRERNTIYSQDGISPTLLTSNCSNQRRWDVDLKFVGGSQLMQIEKRIRRLTPIECERLMSWPDDWSKYGVDESGNTITISDSRRYKCIGNGIVSNVSKKIFEDLIPPGRVFSICSGVDGSCLALDKDRWPKVGFVEYDKYPASVLKYRYPDIKNWGDLTKMVCRDLPDFEILFSSVPCQAFSVSGHRRGFEDTRGTLFYDMARILHEKNPKYFVFENVAGLLSHDKGRTFEIMCETFCEAGYEIDFELLNAKYFGVAQNRERVFIVGRRLDSHWASIL